MLAHPEAERIFWVDSDLVFTDIDFKPPLEMYRDHNLVVHGWLSTVYEQKNWGSVNSGVFFIRNCQWSNGVLGGPGCDGPNNSKLRKVGWIVTLTMSGKIHPEVDDQLALVYLLLKEKDTWGKKIYMENQYDLSGYCIDFIY